MRFDDYIPNLFPVLIFDSLQNVQLTLLYVNLEQVYAFNTVFTDNLRDSPEFTKKCLALNSFVCYVIKKRCEISHLRLVILLLKYQRKCLAVPVRVGVIAGHA